MALLPRCKHQMHQIVFIPVVYKEENAYSWYAMQ